MNLSLKNEFKQRKAKIVFNKKDKLKRLIMNKSQIFIVKKFYSMEKNFHKFSFLFKTVIGTEFANKLSEENTLNG